MNRNKTACWQIQLLGCVLSMLWTIALCYGQGTSKFTYQGRLNSAGAPADGTFDFEFSIYDAPNGGTRVAGIIALPLVEVTQGLFSVSLDPGFGVFDGNPRWLEISVRTSGAFGPYTTLTPRQQFTATPYALFSSGPGGPAGPPGAQGPQGIPGSSTLGDVVSGVSVSSAIASDPNLLSHGYQQIASIDAPTWTDGTPLNEPSARQRHSTIWTDREVIVWGGNTAGNSFSNSGGRYAPGTDQWTAVSPIGAPSPRADHTGVWTGQVMLVWGGFGASGYQASGGRYYPVNQSWNPVSNISEPSARSQHIGVWNGSRLIIWGGQGSAGLLNDGALYDPVGDAWAPINVANPPEARQRATAVWAGDRLLVWGGEGNASELGSGAQLLFDSTGNPTAWRSINRLNSPSARSGHSVVWTGSRMIVWGGARSGALLADGAVYDPIMDTWAALPSVSAPSARTRHAAVWTGSEMVVLGGNDLTTSLASGGSYSPLGNAWRPLSNGGVPVARSGAGMVWTGSELAVFGGLSNQTPVASLQRVSPQPRWYFYRKP